jgi:hypothetical protein
MIILGSILPAVFWVPLSLADTSESPFKKTIEKGETQVVEALEATEAHLLAHPWDRYVRGFRHEHNFALSLGGSSGDYEVHSFGVINDQSFHSAAAWSKFQYTYHLQIYHGFGYMLGSSAGYFYETVRGDRVFQPAPAVMFPGILAGLVMNFSPSVRLSTAFDVYMERVTNFTANNLADPSKTQNIAVTLVAYDAGGFLDYFYDLNWAVRLEAHNRRVYYYRPLEQPGDSTIYASNAVFRLTDRWLGLGLVYHLL